MYGQVQLIIRRCTAKVQIEMFTQVWNCFKMGSEMEIVEGEEIHVQDQGYHDFNRSLYGWSGKVEVALWSFLMAGPWNHNGIP